MEDEFGLKSQFLKILELVFQLLILIIIIKMIG